MNRFFESEADIRMTMIDNDWLPAVNEEFAKPYYKQLFSFVNQEYKTHTIYPPADDIFNALHLTPLADVKVVILGQDPYHGEGQAHGLSFSVRAGVKPPPSLVNIFKELESDLHCKIPQHGCLTSWARQGVLLLNAVLTVRERQANSHQGIGWEFFTDRVITLLNENPEPLVFILWGSPAQRKASMITNSKHLILKAPHPSPLSAHRGFFGSRPFSKANEFLVKNGRQPIDWQRPEAADE